MSTKRLDCEYEGCDKSYCSSFNLKRHIEITHLGLRRFKCSVCGRFLSSKQNLIDHQNIHTGAKPYVCEVPGCGYPFRQLSQYYIHRQLHSEMRNFGQFEAVSKRILDLLARKLTVDSYSIKEDSVLNEGICEELPKIGKAGRVERLPLFEGLRIEDSV